MTEEELRTIFRESIQDIDYQRCKTKLKRLSRESSENVHGASLGFILASLSIDRQEQILTEQKTVLDRMETQSNTMTKHSWAMIILTVVILAAMGVQIALQLGWMK